MRWNLTSTRHRSLRADALFISFPKSGRTWFRMVWSAYWCQVAGRPFQLDPRDVPGMARLCFTHDRWNNVTHANALRRLLGWGLVAPSAARTKPKLLLVRDPRDVVVSLFFQMTRRRKREQRFVPQSMKQLVHNPDFGLPRIVDLMNGWRSEWGGTDGFRVMRYEDARSNAEASMREWFAFFGVRALDEAAFDHALKFSDFQAVQRREKAGEFTDKLLRPGDTQDPESFKARRGKVGGFRDYFDAADCEFGAAQVARLDPRFGYAP